MTSKLARLEQAARRSAASKLQRIENERWETRDFMRQFCPHFSQTLHKLYDDATGNVVIVYVTRMNAMRVCCMEIYTDEGDWRLRWDKEV